MIPYTKLFKQVEKAVKDQDIDLILNLITNANAKIVSDEADHIKAKTRLYDSLRKQSPKLKGLTTPQLHLIYGPGSTPASILEKLKGLGIEFKNEGLPSQFKR